MCLALRGGLQQCGHLRREYLLLADALAALKKLIKKLCTQSCPVATGMVEGKSRLKDGGGLVWFLVHAEADPILRYGCDWRPSKKSRPSA